MSETPETTGPIQAGPGPSAPERAGPDEPNGMILAEEQLTVGTEWHPSGRVRIHQRVVTDTRTVQVSVRRQELVVEPVDLGGADQATVDGAATAPPPAGPDAPPTLVIVLHEEIPEIVMRTRAYEQVTISVDRVAETTDVTDTLRREQVTTEVTGPAGQPDRG